MIFVLGAFAAQPAAAQTETLLYSFPHAYLEPLSPLIADSSGILYGAGGGYTPGTLPNGAVFELVNSSGSYTAKVLYKFAGPPNDGTSPAGLVADSAGNLYGLTLAGGASSNCTGGCGIAFELVNSGGTYTEKVLYSFGASPGDGIEPNTGLILDGVGNLYGTTFAGGSSTNCQFGCGTVFELVNSSGSYTEKLLYSFTGLSDGAAPNGNLIMDSGGNLYGATQVGGPSRWGTIFELVNMSGSYTEKVLYGFAGAPSDGRGPTGVLADAAGNLFGTTLYGGTSSNCTDGCGTAFELVNASGIYTEKLLHSFTAGADGSYPTASLVMDAAGRLYGTTSGSNSTPAGNGTIFELVNSSGGYGEYVLHPFAGSPDDGAVPFAGLMIDSAGTLYGTTNAGGANSGGTVFALMNSSALAVALTPSYLAFGDVLLGSSPAKQTVTVNNLGNANLIFAGGAVTLSGANAADFSLSTNGCSGQTLAPISGSCSVTVAYAPTALGSETASLSFADNASGSPQIVMISGTGQDFSLTTTDSSQTVSRGNDVTYNFYINPLGGYTGTVTLACAGCPPYSICTVGAPVTLDGNLPSLSGVTVATNGSSIPQGPEPPAGPPVAVWITLAGLAGLWALARFRARRGRIRVFAPLALVIVLAFAMSCGGGGAGGGSNGNPYHNPPTPTGTYTLVISGTSGGVTHTLNLTLTVQ